MNEIEKLKIFAKIIYRRPFLEVMTNVCNKNLWKRIPKDSTRKKIHFEVYKFEQPRGCDTPTKL